MTSNKESVLPVDCNCLSSNLFTSYNFSRQMAFQIATVWFIFRKDVASFCAARCFIFFWTEGSLLLWRHRSDSISICILFEASLTSTSVYMNMRKQLFKWLILQVDLRSELDLAKPKFVCQSKLPSLYRKRVNFSEWLVFII